MKLGKDMKERGKELAPIREMAFQIWKVNPEIKIKALHSQLKDHGYEVNYYTLRSWLVKWREGKGTEKKERFSGAKMKERGKELAPIRQTAFEIWGRNPEIKAIKLQSVLKQYGHEINISTCGAWLFKWRKGKGLARKMKVEAEPMKAEPVKVGEITFAQIVQAIPDIETLGVLLFQGMMQKLEEKDTAYDQLRQENVDQQEIISTLKQDLGRALGEVNRISREYNDLVAGKEASQGIVSKGLSRVKLTLLSKH